GREAGCGIPDARQSRRQNRRRERTRRRVALRPARGPGAAQMTTQERIDAIVAQGFTPRQAAFVLTVLLHSGVCVPRQYCAFVGTVWGKVARDFFRKLSDRKLATMYAGGASGGSIFHIHRKSLYRAIGETNSRLGRRGTVTRAVERLMVLDAVLANR